MTRWDRDAEIDRLHHLASCRVDFIGGDIPWTERPWGPEAPAIATWRLTEEDRALYLRAREATGITGVSDLIRFALGAAVREMTRAAGGS